MKAIAQVLNIEFARMLADRFNGLVNEKMIDNKQMFIVIIHNNK